MKKTNFIRLLVLMMVLITSVSQIWARTYENEEILYVKNIKPTNWNDAWVASSGTVWAVFDGASGTNVEGAKLTGTHGNVDVVYAFQVPDGIHTTVTLYRGGSVGSEWNYTSAITLDATKNYISGGYTENSTSATWDNLSLNFKKDQRLYLKSNGNWRDESAKLEIYLWDGSHSTWVTFPSKIDDTDYHYITIPDRNWAYGIVVRRNSSSSGSSDSWTNVWNQTNDIPSNSDATKNCIILNNFTSTGTVTWETIYYNLTAVRTPTTAADAPTIGLSFTSSNVSVSAADPNTGYHWVNWTSPNGTFGTATNQSTTFTPTASSAVATANYAVNQKIVRFNANGGSGSMSNQTYNYNVAQNLTANSFTKTGYNFAGWATSEDGDVAYANSYNLTLTPDANEHGTYLDLYAVWTPITYTIVFDKNNVSATGSMSNKAMTYDVAANLTSNAFELDGYSFIGWDTKSDGSGTRYLDGAEVSNLTSVDGGEVTLYAQWAPAYTVTIAAKVGETTIPKAEYDPDDHTFIANTTLAVSQSAPTIAGYDFSSWTLDGNLTSADATANPIAVTASADATLTANYTYHSYTVTYPSNVAYTFSNNDASVAYKSTGHFTVTPNAGYTIAVSASDASGSVTLYPDVNNSYSFVQGTSSVTISVTHTEVENTITVVNGTPTSVKAKVASTTATVTANAAPAGKKFARWTLGTGITLVDCEATDRVITFNASQNTTITAQYKDRDTKTVHFAKPYGWSTVTAMFYEDETAETDEVEATSTSTYEGATYYSFTYFVDNTGEVGGDQSAQNNWNKVVFSDNGSNALAAKTINNGYYYAKGAEEANGRTTPYAEWYLRGRLNNVDNWTSNHYARPFTIDGTSATFAFGVTVAGEQYYRLYRISTGEWFRYGEEASDLSISLDTPMTLGKNGNNADKFTSELGVYLFTLTNLNSEAPSLTVTHPEDTKYTLESISASGHGSISAATDTITQLGRYIPKTIEATADAGYRFKEWVTTGGVVVADPTSASTTATATADGGTITATFTNKGIVYLDLSVFDPTWGNNTPYVYFYSGSYWNDKGSGSENILYGGERMTQIGDSKIWYYDYSSTLGIANTKNYIAFTDKQENGYKNFSGCNVIYRGDFFPDMNTFVPQVGSEKKNGETYYFNSGYWMKYNEEEAGYNLRTYDGQGNNLQETIHFTSANPSSREYTAVYHVDGAASAKFELVAHDQGTVNGIYYSGTFYGNTGTINSTITEWDWEYTHGTSKASINLNAKGDYLYTLKCGTDGKLYVKVTFPIAVNDFRIKYSGLVTTKDDSPGNLYSDVIPQLTTNGTRVDTVSFFITKDNTNPPGLSLQECTAINASTGVITWGASAVSFSAATGTEVDKLASGVYLFEITQTKSGATRSFIYKNLGLYNGQYYVRTDCAHGGWVGFKHNDHIMHETNYDGAGYNRYFCRFVESGNIKFCVANDYNSELTEQIADDDFNTLDDGYGTLKTKANTRFEYDYTTNVVSRSYIGASDKATFLYIRDASVTDRIKKINDAAFVSDTAKFIDQQNWIYMMEVKAQPASPYKLEAQINGNTQYFVGAADKTENLLGGSGDTWYTMHLVYDFKNNHLIKAWLPSGVVSGEVTINADVMLVREGQAAATQLDFANAASKLKEVHNVYGVLGFSKTHMTDGDKSSYERSLYWVSFPFDVKLKDIFGFGVYGEDYIVRRYNGALRAQKGWFAGDGVTNFWQTMDPDSILEVDNTMKAYEGYMVALDRGLQNGSNSHWYADGKSISEVYLYFPSSNDAMDVLSKKDTTITLDTLICHIDRVFTQDLEKEEKEQRNHTITDSNWRVIGVGSLHNAAITVTDLDGGAADIDYYAWDPSDNSMDTRTCTQDVTTFNAGHAVMIQWAGKLTWRAASVPASVAARHTQEEPKNYCAELELSFDNKRVDHTYVILKENASAEFILNEDLYKVTNANKSNIYSFAGGYDCGINRMPFENTTVAVGVIARKKGNYTFSMPNNFSGTVTLIDTFDGSRTNLALEDYTVYLEKGTIDDRFLLEISINNAPTAIDGAADGEGSLKDGKAHKFIMDGQMYILQNGVVYDARGARVK